MTRLPTRLIPAVKRIAIAPGVKAPLDASRLFAGLEIVSIDAAHLDLSGTCTMSEMFAGCASLTELSGLSCWHTSRVFSMGWMFSGCTSLADLSSLASWDTSQTTCLCWMFQDCASLTDLSPLASWDVSQAEDMSRMFWGCTSLSDAMALKDWKVQKDACTMNMFPPACVAPSWQGQSGSPSWMLETLR